MKKILASILLVLSLIAMVSCNDTVKVNKNNQESVKLKNYNQNLGYNKFIVNEKLYEMHEKIFPKVKNYYESLGYKLEDKTDDEERVKRNDFILYRYSNENNTKNIITQIDYVLTADLSETENFLSIAISMNINKEEYKAGNFKFEESQFFKLNELLEIKDIDYSNINKQVYDYYNGKGSDSVEIKTDGFYYIMLYLRDEGISYDIRIYDYEDERHYSNCL